MQKIFLAGATGSIGKNVCFCIKEINKFYKNNNQKEKTMLLVGLIANKNLLEIKKCIA
jgi:1-deoxy-D-xylulose 5-phosphate reductoisomerase